MKDRHPILKEYLNRLNGSGEKKNIIKVAKVTRAAIVKIIKLGIWIMSWAEEKKRKEKNTKLTKLTITAYMIIYIKNYFLLSAPSLNFYVWDRILKNIAPTTGKIYKISTILILFWIVLMSSLNALCWRVS